jgi:hypothetical protein
MKQAPKESIKMRIRPSRAASEQSGLIRKKAWIKLIAIAFRIILRKDYNP